MIHDGGTKEAPLHLETDMSVSQGDKGTTAYIHRGRLHPEQWQRDFARIETRRFQPTRRDAPCVDPSDGGCVQRLRTDRPSRLSFDPAAVGGRSAQATGGERINDAFD
jgi:hypothetical protein